MSHEPSSTSNRIATLLSVVAGALAFIVVVLAAEQRLATDVSAEEIVAADTGLVAESSVSASTSASRPEHAQAMPSE